MASRRAKYSRAKTHRNYSVEEAARVMGVCKGTVRQWIKVGLPVIDDQFPTLILGRELRSFHEQRQAKRKKPCKPGEIYCVKCREPKFPALNIVDYVPLSGTGGNLVGICPDCEKMVYRRVSLAKLEEAKGNLEVTFPDTEQRISKSELPSLNTDSGKV